jgi:hypothetical protein
MLAGGISKGIILTTLKHLVYQLKSQFKVSFFAIYLLIYWVIYTIFVPGVKFRGR